MDTLRFITCGSVDDGKSTLIGRLLYDTKLIFEDQLEALKVDSKKFGTQGERLETPLHRCRYPGARAVHAQHGDRRLDRAGGCAAN